MKKISLHLTKNNKILLLIISLFLVGIVIVFYKDNSSHSNHVKKHIHLSKSEETSELWTCSMHPQIRQSDSGQCPICGMDLVKIESVHSSSDDKSFSLSMSPTAMHLAQVQTAIVREQTAYKTIYVNGRIQTNEQYLSSQTSHITGRIEHLLLDYTGAKVHRGQPIAVVYSPELVTAQEELFEAYKIRKLQPALYDAAIKKLRNWKLTTAQINHIIKKGKPQEKFTILSDLDGVVITKHIKLGDHIKEGTKLYSIADLSRLWILFDFYEDDLPWVHRNDTIQYQVYSLTGKYFSGCIKFIDPVINTKTRIARARIEINNKENTLRPGMFVKGKLRGVSAIDQALVIPKTSVLWTGKRSIVYVQIEDDMARFKMRRVTIGADLGESYVVTDGLHKGERIVVNGAFAIDAAAQLADMPSMMHPMDN